MVVSNVLIMWSHHAVVVSVDSESQAPLSKLMESFENSNDSCERDDKDSTTSYFVIQRNLDSTEKKQASNIDIDWCWNGRLIRLGNEAAHMQYLIAYLSTLGGAYHLCNHPKTALGIARKLEAVALRLGSTAHLVRSRTYQAVNLYLLGKKRNAKYFLAVSKETAKQSSNSQLISFVEASENWLKSIGDVRPTRCDKIAAV